MEDFELDIERMTKAHQDFMRALAGESLATKPKKNLPERPTIRLEFVKTKYGKAGPYYYAYWREGKKVKKKYLGKDLPPELQSRYRSMADNPRHDDADISAAMSSMF
jgi:hypothetical protein